MDPINDARFYESLIKPPRQRTQEDIRNIYEQLRQLDMFSNLYNGPLKAICANARYERHAGHHILYRSVTDTVNVVKAMLCSPESQIFVIANVYG
ncbi:hypothetical protein ANCDUO_27586 [Ancylostoma duodenale]|uniref:Uncharacterized protein n=1 Tax=Ancylostoma duodenale TaxID=51022 RepID=A0A0C2F612_9BILA|nr:hypothetical protein ANCDUO_27586 [Ancylostoma duodenale]